MNFKEIMFMRCIENNIEKLIFKWFIFKITGYIIFLALGK